MNQLLQFDKRRSRVKQCPCGRSNKDGKFVPFKGFEDKGYCHSCGKTFYPTQNSQTRQLKQLPWNKPYQHYNANQNHSKPYSTLPNEYVEKSMTNHDNNNLIKFLSSRFSKSEVEKVISTYKIGGSNLIAGATVFWYIDIDGKVRSGKVMKYDPVTGKRIKDGYNTITWVHKLVGFKVFNFTHCLYGEPLLKTDSKKPVAIVESEKTAIISSIYEPGLIWLATGGIQNFKAEVLQVLKDRQVIVYPDLGAFDVWKKVVDELPFSISIDVSTLLEKNATSEEKAQKLDIADFFLRKQPINDINLN